MIRITMKWWYKLNSNNNNKHIIQVKSRFVYNQNASWIAHLVNHIGFIFKLIFNYDLYYVSSFEWFKKKAIEQNRQELNGFELNDFGDEMEMKLFEKIYFGQTAYYRADPLSSALNLRIQRNCFLLAMKERLRIVYQLKSHPEIRQINIQSPICIMGLPRTGTTLLYNLMALDSMACYPTFHLSMNPSLPWTSNNNELLIDPRVAISERLLRRLKLIMPNVDKAHYIDPYSPEECLYLFRNMGLDYLTLFSEQDLLCLKHILDDIDFEKVYEYHRLLLQFLCYKKSGFNINQHHCLLKFPFHIFHLPSFLKVYKNARVIITHRDLNQVVPSLASLMEISSNLSYIDRFGFRRRSLQICGILSDILVKETTMENNNKNFIHISYSEVMKNPHEVIKNIYAQCELKYTEEFDKKITKYLEENPQGKHGRHQYSLGDYGLSEVELRYRFHTYSKTFLTTKS